MSRPIPMDDEPLVPEDYPWRRTTTDGVLTTDGFVPSVDLDSDLGVLEATPLAERHRVLAVGSNASPRVMHTKMAAAGVVTPLAMSIVRHDGLAVGHSAHVSLRGFIPAAPYRCSHCSKRFVLLHLNDEQLEALDATEPNYDRVDHDGRWVYASHWQVLATHGVPVTLRPQGAMHDALAAVDEQWADEFSGMSASRTVGALAHDGSTNEWRRRWAANGLVRDAGFELGS